jgi:ADP-ribose pyrophosphatase YjhB (NUDIX family)
MQNFHKTGSSIDFDVAVRGLIVDRGELLMVRHSDENDYYALPGGRVEVGEHLRDAMARELLEETGIEARVGNPLIINDWVGPKDHRVEFFFWILNPADFRHADIKTASHGFEIAEILFADPADYKLLPDYLVKKFSGIASLGNDYPTELATSI